LESAVGYWLFSPVCESYLFARNSRLNLNMESAFLLLDFRTQTGEK